MSNTPKGPQSRTEAIKAAEISKRTVSPGGYTNTTGWNAKAKENFYGKGGK